MNKSFHNARQSVAQRMQGCPKFATCSAPICPLDPDWPKRTCMSDDRVCSHQLKHAAGKPIHLEKELQEILMLETPKIVDRFPRIKRQMVRSTKKSALIH